MGSWAHASLAPVVLFVFTISMDEHGLADARSSFPPKFVVAWYAPLDEKTESHSDVTGRASNVRVFDFVCWNASAVY